MIPRRRLRSVGDQPDETGRHLQHRLLRRRTLDSRDIAATAADPKAVSLVVDPVRAALGAVLPRLEDRLEPGSDFGTTGLDHNRSRLLNVLVACYAPGRSAARMPY